MSNLKEVFLLFFKLGWIAFGGPAAHIALMEEEVVSKRKWMSRQEFLDLMGATNLIPGPNSTEMVMHCGYQRAGVAGLFVAGLSFLFPATVLTGILAFFYVKYGSVPAIEPILYGIKPAVIVIILGAVWKLGKKAVKTWQLAVIGAAVLAATMFGLSEVAAVFVAGGLGMILIMIQQPSKGVKASIILPFIMMQGTAIAGTKYTATKLFWVFLKVGATLFGSGYVLVAYLDGELVDKLGWLTQNQLMDAIAMGQFTPGPVLSTATFVGYQVGGVTGAVLATLGIFLPSFLFVWLLNPLVPKLRSSKWARGFLDGVNVGAVAVMVAVTLMLMKTTLVDYRSWIIAVAAFLIVFVWKKNNAVLLVLFGAIAGYLLHLLP